MSKTSKLAMVSHHDAAFEERLEHPTQADIANAAYREKEQRLGVYLLRFFKFNLEGEMIYEAEFGLKRILNYLSLDPGFLKLVADAKAAFDQVLQQLSLEEPDGTDLSQDFFAKYGPWLLSIEKLSGEVINLYREHCVFQSEFRQDSELSSRLASEILLTISKLFATSHAWERHISEIANIKNGVMQGIDAWSRSRVTDVFPLVRDGMRLVIENRFSPLEKILLQQPARNGYRKVILRDPTFLDPDTLQPVRMSDGEGDMVHIFAESQGALR